MKSFYPPEKKSLWFFFSLTFQLFPSFSGLQKAGPSADKICGLCPGNLTRGFDGRNDTSKADSEQMLTSSC